MANFNLCSEIDYKIFLTNLFEMYRKIKLQATELFGARI